MDKTMDQNFIEFSVKKSKAKVKFKEKSEPKGNYPPKKGKLRKTKNNTNALITEDIEFIDIKSTKTKPKKNKKNLENFNSSKKLVNNDAKSVADKVPKSKKIKGIKFDDMEEKDKKEEEKKEEEKIENKKLDNFELNNLEYDDACKFDKRSFCAMYWSVLKREHSAIFTFFSFNDYNLFYIKIERFLILFCTDMTMNGLFFVHESMHKKYTQGEDFTFVQKLPQILFTLIVSHVLEVLLCYLSMTDVHFYEIKSLPKSQKNGDKIVDILDCIRKKLVSFFVFTFLLFLFYWYFISAFCAVYQNTQTIFLRDSMISFLTAFIDPFIIYGFTCILRKLSLSVCCRKKCGCIYKLSDLIPIF